jgi:hypothetical protein
VRAVTQTVTQVVINLGAAGAVEMRQARGLAATRGLGMPAIVSIKTVPTKRQLSVSPCHTSVHRTEGLASATRQFASFPSSCGLKMIKIVAA